MVGQEKLLKSLESFTLDDFPKICLLVGDKGSGKHLLVNELSQYFNLSLIDITDKISKEDFDSIYQISSPTFYLIDLMQITEKEQNMLLKFLEDPPLFAYIILLSETKINLIDTLSSRCQAFEMESYSKEELKQFTQSDYILSILKTPGQILNTSESSLKNLQSTCDLIVDKVDQANYNNTLSLLDKFNYKDTYDKFDINVFFNVLLQSIYNKYEDTKNVKILDYYKLTLEQTKMLRDDRLNKRMFLENYFTKLWRLSHNE